MTKENEDKSQKGKEPNSDTEVTPNPSKKEEKQPSKGGVSDPNPNEELTDLQRKHDELKRQYGSSSEEAIRLTQEVEELKDSIKNLEASKTVVPQNDEEFNQRVAEVGMAVALREIVADVVKPLTEKVRTQEDERVDKILAEFKGKHPGLKDDTIAKFDKEFDRLKSVYPSVYEAMEAAYRVVGGEQADTVAKLPEAERLAVEEAARKADEEKANALAAASGDAEDRRPIPKDPNAELIDKMSKIREQAIALDVQGRESLHLWTQHEQMKDELARKEAARSV